MPELPEVETSRRGIAPHIENRKLTAVEIRQSKLRWPVPVDAIAGLQGQVLNSVSRRGKYLKLHFTDGYILIHLGMSGSVRIVSPSEAVGKHDHFDLIFDDRVLRFNDPRKFGCCLYQQGDVDHELLQKLGPEPLSDSFDSDYLYQASRGKTQSIKSFIMDSQRVVGVGNIYASESLFRAGINPKRAAGKVSRARYEKLTQAIKQVLAAAIDQGGTTLKDFVGGDGKPGYFKQELMVYGRDGEPCFQCEEPVKKLTQGQRSTFYCSQCQK